MGKILVFASIVFTLLSAALGFVNKGKLSESKENLATAEASATKAQADATKVAGELKTASENLATVTSEKAALESQITALKSAEEAAKAEATRVAAEKTELESKITQLDTDLKAAQTKLTEMEQAGSTAAAQSGPDPETQAKLAEQETLIAKLQADLDASKSQMQVLQAADQDRRNKVMRKGLEGRILAVNPAWNFVVLNLGDKNGVISNSELLVKRGNQFVGKVRITSVEPSTSIADIVAASVPQGTTIAPGDSVIYQVTEEE